MVVALNSTVTLQDPKEGLGKKAELGAPTCPEPPQAWAASFTPASCSHLFCMLHFLIRNLSLADLPKRQLPLGIQKGRLPRAHPNTGGICYSSSPHLLMSPPTPHQAVSSLSFQSQSVAVFIFISLRSFDFCL